MLAPTLVGYAGGPEIEKGISDDFLLDSLERAMDDVGFETAHVVGTRSAVISR